MRFEINPIVLPFMFNITVNCYLICTDGGFFLIDSGMAKNRRKLLAMLDTYGCLPGDLKLIILTHGDVDHCGNAAYLREKFGAPIAMHAGDAGMVQPGGDMFYGRTPPNAIVRALTGLLMSLRAADRFSPDILLAEGDDLSEYGLPARVVHLPGHSQGSIGVLAEDGSLFCGDLLGNTKQPERWSIMDDVIAADASIDRLEALGVNRVYPGHGLDFALAELGLTPQT